MKKIYAPGIFVVLMLNASKLRGQIVFQREGPADLPGNVIYIANRGTQLVKFSLSLNKTSWQSFQLKARTSGNAWPQNGNNQTMYIKISSPAGDVKRELNMKKRYEILWNTNTNRWDVGEMRPRG